VDPSIPTDFHLHDLLSLRLLHLTEQGLYHPMRRNSLSSFWIEICRPAATYQCRTEWRPRCIFS